MSQAVRKGMNESWFREVNERLEERAAGRSNPTGAFEIICECDREECTERILISIADYESVRETAVAFIVRAGHSDPGCERAVSSHDSYEVVEKFGAAGLVAEIKDPRTDDAGH